MVYAAFEEFETSNLLLRKFRQDDAKTFYSRIGGNEKVTKYMLWKPHESIEETEKSIEKIVSRYESGKGYTWAIVLPLDDSVIGRIDLLRFDELENSCSFAYMIDDVFWGKGYGTEALSIVLKYAFEKMKIQLVIADHMSDNGASGAVMRKVGMSYVGKHISKYEKNGQIYDADEYRITSDEWRKIC